MSFFLCKRRFNIRFFILLFISLAATTNYAQTVLSPWQIKNLNFTQEEEIKFNLKWDKCDSLTSVITTDSLYELLTQEQKIALSECDFDIDHYYDAKPRDCSWYCSGTVDTLVGLPKTPQKKLVYLGPYNSIDFDYSTAWSSPKNTKKHPQLMFYFKADTPRIMYIAITNGWVKTLKEYAESDRAKTILLCYNSKPIHLLKLEDLRAIQYFAIEALGNPYGSNYNTIKPWTLTLEILDVFAGTKHLPCAISEIYFDGTDPH
jgi:hypothetical protein